MPASIWLQLSGDADFLLREVIAALAAQHGTVAFRPHLTVCAFPLGNPPVARAAEDYVKRCGLLPLRVVKAGISCSTTAPFKAVVVDVENHPELRAFREALRDITGAPEPEPPHISLLYTIDARENRVAGGADAT